MTTRHAACSCGQLHLAIEGEPARISMCHCLECQRRTGSVISNQARFRREQVTFAGDDVPDIRSAFATRGAGAGATVTGSTFLTVVESYYPSSAAGAITLSDSLGNNNGIAEPGEDIVITIPLTNRLTATGATCHRSQTTRLPKHVFLIVLENEDFDTTFGPAASPSSYLKQLTKDGVLPNEAGYAVMAQLVSQAIGQALKESSGVPKR